MVTIDPTKAVNGYEGFLPLIERVGTPKIEDEQKIFLADVLYRSTRSENFFKVRDDGSLDQLTLVEMMNAVESVDDMKRYADICLLMSGMFNGFLEKRGVSRSVYLAQGASWYWSFGSRQRGEVQRLYLKNSVDFGKLSDRLMNAHLLEQSEYIATVPDNVVDLFH